MPKTPNLEIVKFDPAQDQFDVTVDSALEDIDAWATGYYGPAAPGTLTTEECLRNRFFEFSGAGTAQFLENVNWYIVKTTTPNLTVRAGASGPTITITDSDWHLIYYTGSAWTEMLSGGGGGGSATYVGLTDTTGGVGSQGEMVRWNGSSQLANESAPYDIGVFSPGTPDALAELCRITFNRSVSFADDFGGSEGSVAVNPSTASVEFDVKKNGSSIGHITVNTSGVFAFVTDAGAVSFVATDYLTIEAPGDLRSLEDIGFTLKGTRD